MNAFSVVFLLFSLLLLVEAQTRTSSRRTIFRPMTRNFVGRRGPVAPSVPNSQFQPHKVVHAPGFKPPTGIAKKLNEAVDFRALARVLLKQ